MSELVCYFCEHIGRSDNLRKHCNAKHSRIDVIDRVMANGLKFRCDTERPTLLVSLKAEGSKENCGYCFDCHTQISMPTGQCPNKVAVIQRHQCRTIKPRTKHGEVTHTPSMSIPAPTGKRTEDDLKAIGKVFAGLKDECRAVWELDVPAYDEDTNTDFKRSDVNILKGITMMAEKIKADANTATAAPGGFSVERLMEEYSMSRNGMKKATRGKALRENYTGHHDRAKADADDDDEEVIYIKEQEDKEWLYGALDMLVAPPKKKDDRELEEAKAALDQLTLSNSDLSSQLLQISSANASHYRSLCEKEEQNRQLLARIQSLEALVNKQDEITHL